MGGLAEGLGGKPVQAPKVPASEPVPVTSDENTGAQIRKQRHRSGYEKTILTGALSPQQSNKLSTLG